MKRGLKREAANSSSSSTSQHHQQQVEYKRPKLAPPNHQELFYVSLSARDRAPELVLSKDQLSVFAGEGGYRMVRATHGVHTGAYFFEVEILESKSANAHVRLGWSTRQGNLQAPCGYDKWSFAYRDIAGE